MPKDASSAKVDELLRQAIAAHDFEERARLIRKAGYWNEQARKAADPRHALRPLGHGRADLA